jgi:hypothetical protein
MANEFSFDDKFVTDVLKLTLKDIFKEKKEKITALFEDYKDYMSEVYIRENKKVVFSVRVPVMLEITELEKELKIEVTCADKFDKTLLDMANSGVVNIRKEHRIMLNNRYKSTFTDKQDLYMEPHSRLDIFYKKALEISTNG